MSKQEAARRIGVSVGTLERYERYGLKGSMRYRRFYKICVTYDVSADYLLKLMREPIERTA